MVVPDRRGTGNSGGVAQDAFVGEAGRYDVEACVVHLMEEGVRNISIVAASNGTTSALDYAVWAPVEGLETPLSMVFMTGGNYTENNTETKESTQLLRQNTVHGKYSACRSSPLLAVAAQPLPSD